ncbi:hypothetical protein AAFF_G00125220 [Aldrovandia affinis]|uniref:Uncharacterized protein n=1 Tax=Aldrovandia affinis TaxID=143900 RepID=A0AAD7W9J7_9TELE|nr:hypothetical protein AAFF_G00125220 [Aldrovandia affinis]
MRALLPRDYANGMKTHLDKRREGPYSLSLSSIAWLPAAAPLTPRPPSTYRGRMPLTSLTLSQHRSARRQTQAGHKSPNTPPVPFPSLFDRPTSARSRCLFRHVRL